MKEKWIKWFPIKDQSKGNFYIDKIEDVEDGLKIFVTADNDSFKLAFIFKGNSWSYRSTNESHRVLTISKLSEEYGVDFYKDWGFFKIENSRYAKWVIEESGGFYDDFEPNHFVFKGLEWIVDVVDEYEPEIETIAHGNK